jgi:hypothetical protein
LAERYARSIKILVRQFAENVNLDVILGEPLGILLKAELLKPIRNLLHHGSVGATRRATNREQ